MTVSLNYELEILHNLKALYKYTYSFARLCTNTLEETQWRGGGGEGGGRERGRCERERERDTDTDRNRDVTMYLFMNDLLP